jgi:hypothetical protein
MIENLAAQRRKSKIRFKVNVTVDLVLEDGTRLMGKVYVRTDERVLDMMNGPDPFFPLRLANQDIVLVRKASVAMCRIPEDSDGALELGEQAAPVN